MEPESENPQPSMNRPKPIKLNSINTRPLVFDFTQVLIPSKTSHYFIGGDSPGWKHQTPRENVETNNHYPMYEIRKASNDQELKNENKIKYVDQFRKQSKPSVVLRSRISENPILPSKTKSCRFLQEKIRLYNFLQRPKGILAVTYHSIMAFFIIISLMFFAFTTVPDLEWWSIICLRVFDYIILSILVTEFILLCWASPCIGKYQGFKGAIRFVCSPFRLLDLLVIAISVVICWTHWLPPSQQHLIWLRCGQVVQILRLETRYKSWRLFSSMLMLQSQAMLITAYMCFLVLIVMSYVVYYCEQDQPDTPFTNIPTSLYWGIITVCSIGYGDISPVTTAGRIICGIFAIIGMVIYTVPPGIIATGLALKIQESNRQKYFICQRVPATRLIQCAWLCYIASENSKSEITWKQHLRQIESSKTDNMNKSWSYFNLRGNIQQHHNETINSNQTSQKHLTPVQKNCVRFIRALKFDVARRKLRNAFRPYDIKDVMQQYSEGHSDVVSRVRYMQNRIFDIEESMDNLIQTTKMMQTAQSKKMDQMEHNFQYLQNLVDSTLLCNRSDSNFYH